MNKRPTCSSAKKVGAVFGLLLALAPAVWGVGTSSAPTVTVQPASQSVATNGTISLSATVSYALGYQWWKDGAAISGANASTLTIPNAEITDTGCYSLVATNALGTAVTLPACVSVGNPSLLAWGYNAFGQLGISTTTTKACFPIRVTSDVVATTTGNRHSLFIKADGTLWAMGNNACGQLGIGTTTSTNWPVFVVSNVVAATAGYTHSLFVKSDGTLWGVGQNTYGQLGNGATTDSNLPVYVTNNVVTVVAGRNHSLFMRADGTLWGMGRNSYGQLGTGTATATNALPICVASNVVTVAAGDYHSLFIRTDGALWGMGTKAYLGTTSNSVSPVRIAESVAAAAAGDRHILFVKTDGTLWSAGFNLRGQLGDGTTTDTNQPIQVANGAANVAGGDLFSVFSKTDGTLWSMGMNTSGELGVGTTADALVPTQVLCKVVASIKSGSTSSHVLAIGEPLAAVTVSSSVGTANSPTGTCFVSLNSAFTNVMTTPLVTSGTTQYVCTGWAATGATPASGSGLTAVVTVTNDTATLSWLWTTNYLLTASAGAGGSVAPISAWVASGATTQLVAAADAGYRFKSWSGDASGSDNPLSVLMNGSKTVAASFVVPPSITLQPANQLVAAGGTLSLSVTASNASGYQWWKDGARLVGQTAATLTIGGAAMTDSGVYSVVITNADDVTLSLPADVAVGGPSLLAWGYNAYGQLGNGPHGEADHPIRVAFDAVTAAAGGGHSLFVKADGTLWAMGNNTNGQLGDGTMAATNRPVFVASNAVATAAGWNHSLFIKADGTLWAMGRNDYGQLGIGTTALTNAQPVCVASNVAAVSAGYFHSLFLKTDGSLWGMGWNDFYQLGLGTATATNALPVRLAGDVAAISAGYYHSLFVKTDGTLWGMGYNNYGQLGRGESAIEKTPAQIASNVVTAAAGDDHSLFVKTDGTLWTMGLNDYGQLGNGSTAGTNLPIHVADDVAAVGAGGRFSLFAKTDGTLQAMGSDRLGQLGIGLKTDEAVSSPTRVLCELGVLIARGASASHALAIGTPLATMTVSTPAGTASPTAGVYFVSLNAAFTNEMTTPTVANGTTQYVCTGWAMTGGTPASGSGLTAVVTVTNDTAVLSWLWTTNYLLTASAGANGSVAPVSVWVAAGATTQLVAAADAGYRFKVWSGDASGNDNPLSVRMDGPKIVVAAFAVSPTITLQPTNQTVAVGDALTLSVTASDALGYQWWKDGARLPGQTGATLSLPHAAGTDSGVYTVVATNVDFVAVSLPIDVAVGNPALYAWGYGGYGQFGNGVCDYCQNAHPTPALAMSGVLTAAAGWYHSLFVKADGTLWGAGDNLYGQLGNGTTEHDCRPVYVTENVLTVAAGHQHSLFVKADGTLWAMGLNTYGQLGNGEISQTNSTPVCVASNVVSVSAGCYHSLFVKSDGTLWKMGLGNDMATKDMLPVRVADGVVSASAGGWHSLFVKADGTLWTMGFNLYGQLGDGTNVVRTAPFLVTNDVISASAGERHSLFARTDGTLWAMGLNTYGQLGVGTAEGTNCTPLYVDSQVASVVGGQYNSVYVKTDGTVWSMGNNRNGQLGDGTTTDSTVPVQTLCDPPAAIITGPMAVHVFAVEPSSVVAVLTVSTLFGTADPAAEAYSVDLGTVFTNAMITPTVTDGPTQYVCTGWAAVGATPDAGSGMTAVVTVTNTTAALTWLWTTNYLLTATAGTGGSVAPTSVWVAGGASTQLTAMADAGYRFSGWSGDASGYENPLFVLMERPMSVFAAFVAAYTTGDHPTPVPWLRQYGIDGTDSAAETADPDGDGLTVWQEYVAGTDPTNATSRLVVTDCARAYGTNFTENVHYREATNFVRGGKSYSWPGGWVTQRVYEVTGFVVAWPSVTGRVYKVKACTNLAEGAWADLPGAMGLHGASPSMVYTNPVPPALGTNLFFKVEVNLP